MSVLYFLESIRTPLLDGFFAAVTHLGSETLFLAIAIIVFWCFSKEDGYYLLTVGFVGTIINQFLKLLCQVPRPWVKDPDFTIVEAARADATGYSFPSGHTQSVTGSLGCIARISKKRVIQWICVILILLTGLSRMYLGVHTPADVGVSLLIGTVLVFVMYPLFEKAKTNPKYMYGMIMGLILVSFLYLLFVEMHGWPEDIDPHNLASGTKNAYLLFGCSTAMLLSYFLERKYIRFEVKAVWWAQVIKVSAGLGLTLLIKSGLKAVLGPVFAGHNAANAVRYFLIVIFAVCIWPMTFRYFSLFRTKGKKEHS